MNQTATALGNQSASIFSNTSPGVIVVLIVVALLAVVTIVGLVYGTRQQRRRTRAEAEVEHHAEEEREATGDEPAPATPGPVDLAAPAPAVPMMPGGADADDDAPAPAPSPLASEPIPAADAATANPAAIAEAGAEDAAEPSLADAPVTVLKGLGPKVAAQLGTLGIATVGDLAALDDRAAQDLDARLGAFTGRMTRDRWLEQARLLAAGDRKGFEARFGKL